MSQRVVEFDRLDEYNEVVAEARQSMFEAAGGQGPVQNFIDRGASDEGFKTMSPTEQQHYLDLVGSEPLVQIKDVMKGRITPPGLVYQRPPQP